MGDPLSLLAWVLVWALVVGVVFYALGHVPLPPPLRPLITGAVAILLLVYILDRLGILGA